MLLISKNYALAKRIPEDFGYKHLTLSYQNDKVDLIVISKKGEDKMPKPILFYCQGNLPQPVIIYDQKGLLCTLPFCEAPFLDEYHIVIVSNPSIPIIANANSLDENQLYKNNSDSKMFFKKFMDRNYLDYFVFRNNFIIKQLYKQRWVKCSKLAVFSHAEGCTIAAKMTFINCKITKLIYCGGQPYGKPISVLFQQQSNPKSDTENHQKTILFWKKIVENPNYVNYENGISFKEIYSFSLPQKDNLLQLKIPIFFVNGLKDTNTDCNELFQMESVLMKKNNFTFKNYANLKQSFFEKNSRLLSSFQNETWNAIAKEWLLFLREN